MCGFGGCCSNPICENCKPKLLTCPQCGASTFLFLSTCHECGFSLDDELKGRRWSEWEMERDQRIASGEPYHPPILVPLESCKPSSTGK